MVFFVQGPGQVLLDSGIPPIMENPAESSKRRPNSSTIPENYFGWCVGVSCQCRPVYGKVAMQVFNLGA